MLRTGKSQPVNGPEPLSLKRSLVNGSQRLELVGSSAARLASYKSLGCFVEIIHYQTRLFVAADRAAGLLAALNEAAGR